MHDAHAGAEASSPLRRRAPRFRAWFSHTRRPLVRYILRRAATGVVLVLVLSSVVFFATAVLPGDAATAVLGQNATPEAVHALRERMGLNRSVFVRYGEWMRHLGSGDLGESITANVPITSIVGVRFRNTFVLALVATFILVPLSLGLGVLAGRHPGGLLDRAISASSLAALSVPEFVTATVLILLFAVKLRLVPPVSLVAPGQNPLFHPTILVLPVVTLVITGSGYTIRMIRAGVVEVMNADFVQAARLNGVGERRILVTYALRNGLAPGIQAVALTLQWLVGGVFIVETVFAYPGIGEGLVQAVIARDTPYVQAIALVIAALYVAINILADVATVLVIPRLRTTQ